MSTASKSVGGRRLARTASVALLGLLMTPTAFAQAGGSGMNQQNQIPNEFMVKFAAGVSVPQARETILRTGAQIVGDPVLDGRLFHVRAADSESQAAVDTTLKSTPGVEYVEPVQAVSIPTPPR